MQGLASYKGLRKETSRGHIWNRIVERLEVRPKEARGAFLAGPEIADLKVAHKKGFRLSNLVAIDNQPANVKAARKLGVLAIEADALDVLKCWNDEPLDFVYLDTCSAFGFVKPLTSALMHGRALKHRGAIAVNLQRGRDADAMYLMNLLREFVEKETLHRGELLVYSVASSVVWGMLNSKWKEVVCDDTFNEVLLGMEPCIYSYPSDANKALKMDAAVFKNPFSPVPRHKTKHKITDKKYASTKRRLAALKAIKTRMEHTA